MRRKREVTWPQDVTSGEITTTYLVIKEEEVKGKHTHLNLDVRHTGILQREREASCLYNTHLVKSATISMHVLIS